MQGTEINSSRCRPLAATPRKWGAVTALLPLAPGPFSDREGAGPGRAEAPTSPSGMGCGLLSTGPARASRRQLSQVGGGEGPGCCLLQKREKPRVLSAASCLPGLEPTFCRLLRLHHSTFPKRDGWPGDVAPGRGAEAHTVGSAKGESNRGYPSGPPAGMTPPASGPPGPGPGAQPHCLTHLRP